MNTQTQPNLNTYKRKSRAVAREFNVADLNLWCNMTIDQCFDALGGKLYTTTGGRHMLLEQKEAKILVVAHLDTVCQAKHFCEVTIKGEPAIVSPRLDDRLGAYIAVELLPRLGIKADILFTENEERGMSTASDFIAKKTYNWIVEFDRRGTDVVTYQYEWPTGILEQFFKKVGIGSYSDIADLDHLGVCAVNVACGYYDEHTDLSYVILPDLFSQVARFKRFYQQYANVAFPYKRDYSNLLRGGWWESSTKGLAAPARELGWCCQCHHDATENNTLRMNGSLYCTDCGDVVLETVSARMERRDHVLVDDDDYWWDERERMRQQFDEHLNRADARGRKK